MDFSFLKNNFNYLKREITSILYLEKSLELTIQKFRPSHVRSIKKAEKRVLNQKVKRFSIFFNILEKNLKIRHNVSPTHTVEELMKIHDLFPERCNLFGAFIDDRMIAGVVNFIINSEVVLAFYISHNEEHKESDL